MIIQEKEEKRRKKKKKMTPRERKLRKRVLHYNYNSAAKKLRLQGY